MPQGGGELECTRCRLHLTRTNIVWGEGPVPARLMLVGEGPGFMEDVKGRPFCGPAGALLEEALERVGLRRSEVYVTNVVKCRPPGNRRPSRREVEACRVHLLKEIIAVRPLLVGALGLTAINVFMSTPTVGRVRRILKPMTIGGHRTSVVGCYHPASPLHRPSLKEELFRDVEYIGEVLRDGVKD